MVSVDKVTLKRANRKKGRAQTIKVDAYDYAINMSEWNHRGYTMVISEQRGQGTAAEQDQHNREIKANLHRQRDPEREKKFGDRQRAQDFHKIEVTTDWEKMKWVDRRRHVKQVTGTTPKSMVQAKELMDAHNKAD